MDTRANLYQSPFPAVFHRESAPRWAAGGKSGTRLWRDQNPVEVRIIIRNDKRGDHARDTCSPKTLVRNLALHPVSPPGRMDVEGARVALRLRGEGVLGIKYVGLAPVRTPPQQNSGGTIGTVLDALIP